MHKERLQHLAGIITEDLGRPTRETQYASGDAMLRSLLGAIKGLIESAEFEEDPDVIIQDLRDMYEEYMNASVRTGRGGMG